MLSKHDSSTFLNHLEMSFGQRTQNKYFFTGSRREESLSHKKPFHTLRKKSLISRVHGSLHLVTGARPAHAARLTWLNSARGSKSLPRRYIKEIDSRQLPNQALICLTFKNTPHSAYAFAAVFIQRLIS